jgi:nucleoside diphosphate kinase
MFKFLRELAFFFPDLSGSSHMSATPVQRTLALIRPSAFNAHKDEIIKKIEHSGFKIAMNKVINLTKEQAEQFYAEHKGQPFFDSLVSEMSSGSMLALCLVKEDAVSAWRNLLGPKEKEKVKEADGT